jgi:signal transduction histidine kinase
MSIAVPLARGMPSYRLRRRVILPGCALVTLAATAAAAIAGSGAESHPVRVAVARALIVGVPLAVGLFTWSRRPDARFGLLLAGVGTVLLVTTLAESGDEVAYSVGRTAGWGVEVLLVYLILSFPTGRLPERVDRLLVGAMALVALTAFLPRLVVSSSFEVPSPYTSCVTDCPLNAFFALGEEPTFVHGVMYPAGAFLTAAVMVAVLLRLRGRLLDATPLARRMLVPVLAIGVARVVFLAGAILARYFEENAAWLEVAAWLLALAVPVLALALGLGLLRGQFLAARSLERLAACLRAVPDAATLRRAFAESFGDPTLQIATPVRGGADGWIDAAGRPLAIPPPGSGQGVRELRDGDAVVAAIVYDEALHADRALLDAGITMAGIALDNQRLAAETEAAMREVEGSRARIAASAERERRRIERDLHDSAQQRLVALRIELELAEDLVGRDLKRGIGRLRELEHEVDETLDELRSLAHGVYPPLLSDLGIAEALRGAAMRSTIPVEIQSHGAARYPQEVESAVYFCVREAIQNVHKHATSARRIVVKLDAGSRGELRFSVRDDGSGAPGGTIRAGAGITNMHDRLAAVGGGVEVTSKPRVGTTVRGSVPTGRSSAC